MLGSGAYGSVRIKDAMAVKELHSVETLRKMYPGKANIPDVTTPSFLREAMVLCYMNETPHIVQIFEFDLARMQIGMELCAGDLRSWMVNNLGKEKYHDTAIIYLRQIMRGLTSMHDRGMVHGDIKMSNILVCANGEVCLGDLGFASLAEFAAVYHTAEPYRDPHMKAHPCHDVYSFACTAYQLLTGKPISYRERDGRHRSFRNRELRERIERYVPVRFRTELLAMVNSDWERRPSIRKVYEAWFSEEIPVWAPTTMCVVPEEFVGKSELETEITLAMKYANKRGIKRFAKTCYALRYYVSEHSIVEYRLYVTSLLLLTHCCFHHRGSIFKFTMQDACKYASCTPADLHRAMERLMTNRDFLDCFYWNYWEE